MQGEKASQPPASPPQSQGSRAPPSKAFSLLSVQDTRAVGQARPCLQLIQYVCRCLGRKGIEPALTDRSWLSEANGNKDSKGLDQSLESVDLTLNIFREQICWKKTLFLPSLSMSQLIWYWIFLAVSTLSCFGRVNHQRRCLLSRIQRTTR